MPEVSRSISAEECDGCDAYDKLLQEVERYQREIVYIKHQLGIIRATGWNEDRAMKLRRMETVFSSLVNIVDSIHYTPHEVVSKVREYVHGIRGITPYPLSQEFMQSQESQDVQLARSENQA